MGLAALGLLVLYQVRPLLSRSAAPWDVAPIPESPPPVESKERRVPLEAHIMSKCPDARVRGPGARSCRHRC